ncbi:hypothetical protein [Vibrio campbellii]|nr:hypothetical protein [Vibrio campbellii]MBT0122788.1 hypothetical protein [Vibrio campbellii]MBT0137900.1 hypothetical protein [Vibrio campbellii]MBT0142620.1 hypothetical protein [Vibrio campbellii]MBT0147272.1 hypothetical protein [Vibrio campbellii]MBT0151926.1 hypothetical protein [Vibrio campbellii]
MTALMLALLTGCNGASDDGNGPSDNSSTEPNPPSGASSILSAENTVNLSRNMSSSHVLLEGKIHSPSQDGSSIVSSVRPVTELESCKDISFDSTGYTVNFDDFVGVCVYKYDAENSNEPEQKASAYAISVAQKSIGSEVSFFTPISDTTLVGQPLTIDLKNDPSFVTQVPEGYTMDQEITLIGEGEATADKSAQTVTYNPTQEGGFAKIIYSYSNGSEVKLGYIAISVSSSPNTAPNAPKIDYSNDPLVEKVYVNEEREIDLSKYVSDDDGDALQLIYTDSWNAAVSPSDTADMNNLKLTFQTTKVGEHFVSYVISDHYGGYATGLIRIEVYDPESEPSWGNLQLDMKYYFAPLVKSEADAQGATYTSTHIDAQANNANVATFNLQQAKQLCTASGRLPTLDELNTLSKIGGVGPAVYDGWPVEIDYWALDGSDASIVNLTSGATGETPNAGGQYVTCVGEGGYLIDTAQSKLVAIGDGVDQASVAVKATFNGEPLEGIVVKATVTGSANLANTSLVTDAAGYAIFTILDTISEQVTFVTNIENSTSTRSAQLHFTGNPNTAELNLKALIDNQPLTGVNVFSAILQDAAGTPVAGQVIEYSQNPDLTYIPAEEQTNQDGSQQVSVQLKNPGSESYNYIVHAEYARPDGTITSDKLQMRFTANILNPYLESTKDLATPPDVNMVTAVFSSMPDPTNNSVTFEILTDNGEAVFSNGQRKIKIDANKVTKRATAEIKYVGSGGKPKGYLVDAYTEDGQRTAAVAQNFDPVVLGKQRMYKQIRIDEPKPFGYICPTRNSGWEGGAEPINIYDDLTEAGVRPKDVVAIGWKEEPGFTGNEPRHPVYGLSSPTRVSGNQGFQLWFNPRHEEWRSELAHELEYRICSKSRT